MSLIAVLTTGWSADTANLIPALKLHKTAECSDDNYRDALLAQVDSGGDNLLNLDSTFRRRPSGYGPIQRIVSSLVDQEREIRCQIDAFAFAFLKGAKNYDMLMTVDPDSLRQVQTQLNEWKKAVDALTEFERRGNPLNEPWLSLKPIYLALRSIVGRASARDERRTLVLLLVTGPASSDEIKEDLRLNYSLSKRVMSALVNTGALTYRKETSHYAIRQETIPVVLFLVRELMGLDMLAMLDAIKEPRHG